MDTRTAIVALAGAETCGRAVVGGKAAVLGELLTAGFAVPAGVVVPDGARGDPGLADQLAAAVVRLGADQYAVRSSAAAEDLPDASYAGLYETYLDVPAAGLDAAVRRCFAAADAERVTAYRQRHGGAAGGMAVLVQAMVDPVAAGVAFTAHPVTGDREQAIVTAVPGLGEPLVSGEATGEQWTVTAHTATLTRADPVRPAALTAEQAGAVAALAHRVADRYGRPQDVEWAIDHAGRLWLLQARPMTALPDPASWTPPGPGLWMRNFRLGEWLPEPVTPLFAGWLLPGLEDAYLDGMHDSVGVRVPFRWALVNGWYYNATPIPSPARLAHVLAQGRRRGLKVLYHALWRVGRDPVAADRAVLAGLARLWREHEAPRYRHLVTAAETDAGTAPPQRLVALVDQLGHQAGIALWYLAIVGGSAWKMEACLTRFVREHLAADLPDSAGGAQVLLRGLPGTEPGRSGHAVHSIDWYHPTAADLPPITGGHRHADLAVQRAAAEQRCATALADRPALLDRFRQLVEVTQRYAVIREQQARELTLAWPVLRSCVRRLGDHLVGAGVLGAVDDVFFCTRLDLDAALAGHSAPLTATVADRRREWQRQRRLPAPLTLGHPPRLVGDVIDRMVRQARGPVDPHAVVVGHPASAGQATGPVRVIAGPGDFTNLAEGEVLVAPATTPAWTPLFALAAAVVTDGGTLAAHASLAAREYGIPAVVGTGDATRRLHTGEQVTVNGTNGTVTRLDQT